MNTVFIKAAGERAVKTFAQAFLALIGTSTVGLTHLDWQTDLGVSGTAAMASILTSLASLSNITPADASAAQGAPVTNVSDFLPPVALDLAPAKTFPAAKVNALTLPAVEVPTPAVTPVYEAPAAASAAAAPAAPPAA